MSESGCQSSLQCESRFGKCDLETERDCGFMGSRSGQSAIIYNDLPNNPLALPGEERNGVLCKTEVPVQSVLKNDDGLVSPVLSKENLPHDIRFSSPDCYSASKVLSVSNISPSYFADPTVPEEKEEQESAEISSIDANKYFSTPMPSMGRVKKKLTPVMEVDFESNMSEEWKPQDKVSTTEMPHKNCANVLSYESPTKTPLYRSFFAAECQEIVNQIESIEIDVGPGKRKAEEFDVSTIDAEPPPYDCTPMKSMLACEVARMISSVESSPVKEGLSFFGESLLDLDKTDMQFTDFNLSECGIKSSKGRSVDDADRLDGICIKRLKTEPLETIDRGHQGNQTSPLPNVLNSLTSETPAMESMQIYTPSKCGHETAVLSSNVLQTNHRLSDNGPAVLMQDMARHVSLVITASPQALVSPKNGVPVNEGATLSCIGQVSETEHKPCASTTQDIVLHYDELPPTDAMHLIDISKASTNARPQSVTSVHEVTIANTTQVMDILPPNTTQDIPFIQEEINIANTTQVMDILPPNTTQDIPFIQEELSIVNTTQVIDLLPPNTTQDIPFIHEEINLANTTQVMEMAALPSGSTTQDISSVITGNNTQVIDVPLSTNTTQDIIPTHEVVTAADTTQVMEGSKRLSLNITQDPSSVHESGTANTTYAIEVMPPPCINTTPDIASVSDPALPANTTPVMEIALQASASTAPGTTSTHDEEIPTGHTQDIGVMQKSADEAIPDHSTDASPKALCNDKDSLDSSHKELMLANQDHLCKDVTQPSLSMVFNAPAQHSLVIRDPNRPDTTGTNRELNVAEGHQLEGYEKTVGNNCTEMASSQKEGNTCKDSRNQPLMSENCSMIQEEENAQDVSVFSVGSLSFVTSTPVPGLSNFLFQKTCRDSVQQDHNMSIGSVLDDSTHRVPGEQRMITQQKSHDAQGLYCKDKRKAAETSRGSCLALNMQRSMVPPSEAMPKHLPSASGIPSARRALALHQSASSHNPAKEPPVSKIAPRSGIPGRGMIRPPLIRQSLPRASLGNPKQAMEGPGGSSVTNKLTGSRFRTPKAAAVKPRSAASHSQLPAAPSSVKPPSRLGAPGTTGRLSMGVQNAAASLHDVPSGETVSIVRPPVPTGIKTGLPRPGTSSIRPPLPQSQKVSPKCKFQPQGLPAKKSQRELPGSRREIVPKAEGTSVVRASAKQANLSLEFPKEAASFQVGIRASSSPNHEKVQSSKAEIASIPSISTELAESGLEGCRHLETCSCCHARYQQLLQENEDLKRRLGQVQHTQVEMTDLAGT